MAEEDNQEQEKTKPEEKTIPLSSVKTVSPTDPDFIIFLGFAIFIDLLDVILELVAFSLDFAGGAGEALQPISWLIDGIALIILGLWMYSKGKEIGDSKKNYQQALQKKVAITKEKLAATEAKSPLRRIMIRTGCCFLGEIFPFLIGILPFWTFSVVMMLRAK